MMKQMKKRILTIISLSLLLVCMILVSGCSSQVAKPTGLRMNSDTLTLSWNKNSSAKGFAVQISGEEEERVVRGNSISLEKLTPGTYEIKIKAMGDGVDTKDSDWVTYNFVREQESGLVYKLINNNTEYQLVSIGKATGDVVMESVYRGKPVTSIADKALSN